LVETLAILLSEAKYFPVVKWVASWNKDCIIIIIVLFIW